MKKLTLLISSIALVATAAFADPHEDREAMMKSFGKSLGELGKMAKGETPFDAAAAQASLNTLNENAMKFDVATLFPEGSAGGNGGDNAASPKIWENMADFQAHVDKFKADVATAATAQPADVAALGASVGAIGKNCGSCHEVYRLKTD